MDHIDAPEHLTPGALRLQRVSAYCALVSEPFGLDRDALRVASRLRDVGMAGVAELLVTRAGPLSDDERREMQQHTVLGHAMLAGSGSGVLDLAAKIALSHHERWDGTGYPHGLAGEAIPVGARIVAVADTFDALTTARPYRSAGSVEAAIETLLRGRASQFDPAVVDAFIERLDDAVDILEALHTTPAKPTQAVDETLMTLQAAAQTLGILPSRLRRWADDGRVPVVRTAGGHRRFPIEAVRRLAAEHGLQPNVRPVEPPEQPLPLLGRSLDVHGRLMVSTAAAGVYRTGPPGWFACDAARDEIDLWLRTLRNACRVGAYAPVLHASDGLMRRAHAHAASLLERHAFLERFGQIAVRTLVQAGAEREEIASARRLFASLQQALLAASH